MDSELKSSAQRVQAALHDAGVDLRVVQLPTSTRSASEAAQAIGCRLEQIAKSLVFRRGDTGDAVLVVASGPNRVDENKLGTALGWQLELAKASFVKKTTGYAIGGVPPLGHETALTTIVDPHLMTLDSIWAAAGTPHAVFQLTPTDLLRITSGQVVEIC
ncbi:MAG: YbaK/EbsC family protein [Thermoanaerobaculia bacterium]|nr:YbaK/EbsC family protein [Thermoanaerobaculia bacterium]